MTIDLSDEISDNIIVYKNDNVEELIDSFCDRYNIHKKEIK